ncbi:MAG: ion transporter [Gemmatimonadaceae bacterium]|nr:ion transporter [Gemmatimonadaceae bacterium]
MTDSRAEQSADTPWRRKLHTIVFEADTPAGRWFDAVLLALIVVSLVVVMLETVPSMPEPWRRGLLAAEWALTGVFSLEYLLRLVIVRRPLVYAGSFFGLVDLLAILPTWVSLIFPGAQALLAVRVLRLLRIFRVFKLARYLSEARVIGDALRASSRKIAVFLFTVSTVVVVVGALMYLIEGPANGFTSIPVSMYWAVVTLTTVGYGDISPATGLGQAVASLVMILGYGIIAVPTGIVTAELANAGRKLETQHINTQVCAHCGADDHRSDSKFCRHCGAALH